MAIKESPMVKRYWPRYRKRAITLTIIMQIVVTLFVGMALIVGGYAVDSEWFWIALIAIAAMTIGANTLLVTQLLMPLKDLSDTLTHVSGEQAVVTPPNPNATRFERAGFKPLLQLIHELAAGRSTKTDSSDASIFDVMNRALNQTSAGIVVLGPENNVTLANAKAPVTAADSAGIRRLSLLFEPSEDIYAWLASCRESTVHAEKTWHRVADRIVGEEGRRIYDVTATYEKGSQAEVVIVTFDQTATYKPEDDDLDFIAFAAHELRGPITVIRGYLDVLGREVGNQLDADQVELMQRLVVSANRLSGYINNILNASRYDRRHMRVNLHEDSILAIYDTINDDMQLRAHSQNRMLDIAIPSDLPTVAADRSSISEVMGNLIDNALKYSNEGGLVSVRALVEGGYVKIEVEDRGIGMPANVVSNLFHKFYRSHRSRETVAGTGIGLYISKAIVESHGGSMGVKSTEGEGSVFSFTLPIYATVAEKLQSDDYSNTGFIKDNTGWIKNHSMYKG